MEHPLMNCRRRRHFVLYIRLPCVTSFEYKMHYHTRYPLSLFYENSIVIKLQDERVFRI